MRRGDQTIRAGTVEVVVLPPFDTSGWRPETVGEHVEQVRTTFELALEAWPGVPSRPALLRGTT
jgi:putative phosphoserine phosphatase/1-acylglycerol-3-phosphate O-acyltransferase